MIITTRPYNSPSTMKRGSRPPSAGVLPPKQRTPKRDPSGLEDEIAVGKSLETLFFVPFKILVAVRRHPKPINRRHSIEHVVVADEAVEPGDPVVERPGDGIVLFRRPVEPGAAALARHRGD